MGPDVDRTTCEDAGRAIGRHTRHRSTACAPPVSVGRKHARDSSGIVSFDLQPTLKGQLLELRPLRAGDFDALFAAASDPEIWTQHPATDRYQESVFKRFFTEQLASLGALVALDAQIGEVIGMSRFHGYDPERSEVEIGWTFLVRSRWGGAYNGEMKRLMLQHAFRFVNRVVFLVHPTNHRSQRAVEKIGGVRTGSRVDGAGKESLVYQITASAPGARQQAPSGLR
jgi:RimJ/RimL family protein N-acetyltransferase